VFERTFFASWGDIDFNSHMGNTAYLNKAADMRMMFFSANGFTMDAFVREKLGPVIMKDEIEYYKEIKLLEEFNLTISLKAISDDGSKYILQNDFYLTNGKSAAKVTSTGGWFDLSARKLTQPPKDLLEALFTLPKADSFHILQPSVRLD